MSGNLGAFVNGNMFIGPFGPEAGLRFPAVLAAEVTAAGGGPSGPAGRRMAGYVSLRPDTPGARARSLAAAALEYVGTFPPRVTGRGKKAGR